MVEWVQHLCWHKNLGDQFPHERQDLLALGLATVCHSAEGTHNFDNDISQKLQGSSIFDSDDFDGDPLRLSSILIASSVLRFRLLDRMRDTTAICTLPPPSPPLPRPDIANFRWVDVIDPHNREMSLAFSILDVLHDEETPWCGYYLQEGDFGGPMRMTIRRVPTVNSGTVAFEGSGSDSVGPFTLQGHIELASRLLGAEKRYVTRGFGWEWSGSVTPFGLVGRWGRNVQGHSWSGGWWWIWPTQWN